MVKHNPQKRETYVAKQAGNQPKTKNTRERRIASIIAIPPVKAMVVMAAARGVSLPDGGDRGLH